MFELVHEIKTPKKIQEKCISYYQNILIRIVIF